MPKLTVLNPAIFDAVTSAPTAPALSRLLGSRIGFVDNSKQNADLFLGRLRPLLEEMHGVKTGATIRKLAPKDQLTDSDVAKLVEYDAVIQCFGDCGTSTSMSVATASRWSAAGYPRRRCAAARSIARRGSRPPAGGWRTFPSSRYRIPCIPRRKGGPRARERGRGSPGVGSDTTGAAIACTRARAPAGARRGGRYAGRRAGVFFRAGLERRAARRAAHGAGGAGDARNGGP